MLSSGNNWQNYQCRPVILLVLGSMRALYVMLREE
jgi:hypothetical protein